LKAVCSLCPRRCAIEEGGTGACRARENRDGRVVCGNYGRLTSLALDPIEKKPLRRFFPGSRILSAGSYGCNLRCPFCQNSEISMADASFRTCDAAPEELVRRAAELAPEGNIGLAFTYNEPLVGYEFVRDCARLAHEAGLKTVLVTNGCFLREPLEALLPDIDAANIDLKGFTPEYYRWLGGDLDTVKEAIALAAPRCHVEVTTLVVPGKNDSPAEMEAEAEWLASVDPLIPLHISRFFPRYRLTDRGPTDVEAVYRLRDVAAGRLKYVYTGNC
jgi:pyruvate formate lyase activating enzyme